MICLSSKYALKTKNNNTPGFPMPEKISRSKHINAINA
jgi:hypothetical protein